MRLGPVRPRQFVRPLMNWSFWKTPNTGIGAVAIIAVGTATEATVIRISMPLAGDGAILPGDHVEYGSAVARILITES